MGRKLAKPVYVSGVLRLPGYEPTDEETARLTNPKVWEAVDVNLPDKPEPLAAPPARDNPVAVRATDGDPDDEPAEDGGAAKGAQLARAATRGPGRPRKTDTR